MAFVSSLTHCPSKGKGGAPVLCLESRRELGSLLKGSGGSDSGDSRDESQPLVLPGSCSSLALSEGSQRHAMRALKWPRGEVRVGEEQISIVLTAFDS